VYLVYLRRQVRMEEEIRRRRIARLSRSRTAGDDAHGRVEPAADREEAQVLHRRAVVLDIDDEDPAFEHLEHFAAGSARARRDRATGGEIRRAAGE
jgi:hypothetical protein